MRELYCSNTHVFQVATVSSDYLYLRRAKTPYFIEELSTTHLHDLQLKTLSSYDIANEKYTAASLADHRLSQPQKRLLPQKRGEHTYKEDETACSGLIASVNFQNKKVNSSNFKIIHYTLHSLSKIDVISNSFLL